VIKEIVDIGRVSNKLASVFTFKGLPEYYVEVLLEWDGKEFKYKQGNIKHLSEDKDYTSSGSELYLKYGVYRERTGDNKWYILLLSSFILDIESSPNKINELQIAIKSLENDLSKNLTKVKEKELKSKLNSLKKEEKKFREDKEKLISYFERGKKSYFEKYLGELRKRNLKKCEEFAREKITQIDFKTKKEEKEQLKNLKNKCKEKYNKNKKRKIQKLIESYEGCIIKNLDCIFKTAELAKLKNNKNNSNQKEIITVPIVVKVKDTRAKKEYFLYEKYFIFDFLKEAFFEVSSNKIKNLNKNIKCNIYQNKIAKYYPKNFYCPYSIDKVNVKYNLQDDKNLFLLSKEAYIDFFKGKTFLETYNSFSFMGLNSFITATSLDDYSLKEFQQDAKESKSDINGLINLIDKNLQNRKNILLNFYFWEYGQNSKDIIEYIKDIIPSNLVQNIRLIESLIIYYDTKFNKNLKSFSWQQHIYNIYYKDTHKKYRTSLFRQIVLNDIVDLEQLLQVINQNMEFGANKNEEDDIVKKSNFPKHNAFFYFNNRRKEKRKVIALKHLMFLDWIDKINKGEAKMSKEEKNKELFVGDSYEERLSYFLENANLVQDSSSMKVGVCVGLAINILSWTLSNYDKKVLAFVSKKIERGNLNSLEAFVNDIFAKTKFQEYESLQSINIKLSSMQMLNLDNESFNKDEFIFGLFLGSELYQNVKSQKDPESENQNEGEEDE